MKVNSSSSKVTNLNADRIDGDDSSDLVQNTGMTTFSAFGPWDTFGAPQAVDVVGQFTDFK